MFLFWSQRLYHSQRWIKPPSRRNRLRRRNTTPFNRSQSGKVGASGERTEVSNQGAVVIHTAAYVIPKFKPKQQLGNDGGMAEGGTESQWQVGIGTQDSQRLKHQTLGRCMVHALPAYVLPTCQRLAPMSLVQPKGGFPSWRRVSEGSRVKRSRGETIRAIQVPEEAWHDEAAVNQLNSEVFPTCGASGMPKRERKAVCIYLTCFQSSYQALVYRQDPSVGWEWGSGKRKIAKKIEGMPAWPGSKTGKYISC